jgi:hypothetical protein
MKAKLRAWLIDLVREAIRIEAKAKQFSDKYGDDSLAIYRATADSYASRPDAAVMTNISANATTFEPSFEQMQAEALKAQEKYYGPAKN